MKCAQICVIMLSAGIFITACNNNPQCPPVATDSTTAKIANMSDGTGAATTPTGTTDNAGAATTGTKYERETQTANAGTGREQGMTTHDTLAASKAANASAAKKRTGNFTNGSPN